MKNKRKILAVAAAIVIVAAVAVILWILPRGERLVLSDRDNGRVYARYAVSDGDVFSVTFVHSVNKTPVSDVYEVRNGSMVLTGTVYYSFGAGVPDELTEGETLTIREDGAMVVTGMDQDLNGVVYAVGTVSDHVLEIGGEHISLRDLCGRNAKVSFTVRG